MDWLSRMNAAINYIEDNLSKEIDYGEVAKVACCSAFDFQRMFSFITSVTLSEYIRRRRLTLAAFELQSSEIKITDLALKYGYNSPVSFARVFQTYHGVKPSQARSEGITLKVWPRLSFHITIKGDVEMNYRIEEKETFDIFGIEKIFTTEGSKNLKEIPQFWQRLHESGEFNKLCLAVGVNKYESGLCPVNAICDHRSTGGSTFPYMVFAMKTSESCAEGYTELTVPAATWAIFSTDWHTQEETSSEMQKLIKRVYTDWLPTASYNKINGFELEMYYGDDMGRSRCETWIRVEKQK